ncbi:hypothetical protein [Methylobacterium sp. J-092]|uniref:hypothetical protein n=1 Tax=Methylobacterium sp. J-092 TaxID=2836667 RepID=UPI001FB8CD2F|nr:hypothetical protein [Methylobacterium sp. J-092]MCJ2009188.1 hypothetical protein [Methylobacterium sp. J-092]
MLLDHSAQADDAFQLTPAMRDLLQLATGLDHRRAPYRNRIAFNVKNEGIITAGECEGFGLIIQDHAEHYGRMRVYRVTRSGFAALGRHTVKATILAPAIKAAEAALSAANLPLPFADAVA